MTAPRMAQVTNLDPSPLPPMDNPESLAGLPPLSAYADKLYAVTGPPPLSNTDMQLMFRMVNDTHRMIMELRDIVDDLPAQLPQLMGNLPPMVRMMLGIK